MVEGTKERAKRLIQWCRMGPHPAEFVRDVRFSRFGKSKDRFTTTKLDGLRRHLEAQSIEYMNWPDLGSIGGLVMLLGYLKHSHSNIRQKAAEIVKTIVDNNPRGQQLVMEAKGLKKLFRIFVGDPDVLVRTKALAAISSLIKNNNPAGILAFRLANGYAALRDALNTEDVGFQREALNLIPNLLKENRCDSGVMVALGLPIMMMELAFCDDECDVREAALRGLVGLAQLRERPWINPYIKTPEEEDDTLKRLIQCRTDKTKMSCPQALRFAKLEERKLLDSLWNARFNQPSPFIEEGLLPRQDI